MAMTRAADLADLRALAIEADSSEVVAEIGALAERLREGRYYLAVLGQFKRGKSTLLNALLPEEAGFRFRSRYYFLHTVPLTTPGATTWFADLLRPERAAQAAVSRAAQAFLERLIEANSTRAISDLNDRVFESKRQLEFEVRARLLAIVTTAERALQRAQAVSREGEASRSSAIERLDRLQRAACRFLDESSQVGR
jgi:hypothetical protein